MSSSDRLPKNNTAGGAGKKKASAKDIIPKPGIRIGSLGEIACFTPPPFSGNFRVSHHSVAKTDLALGSNMPARTKENMPCRRGVDQGLVKMLLG